MTKQSGSLRLRARKRRETQTISPVNVANTAVVVTESSAPIMLELTNGTTITARRAEGVNGPITVQWELREYE